jgi:hypothetical protein
MQRTDNITLTATADEIKQIVKDAIIAKYPALAAATIVVDTREVLSGISEIGINIQTAAPTTVTL